MKKILLLLAALLSLTAVAVSCKTTDSSAKKAEQEDLRQEYYDYDFYGIKEYVTQAELEEDLDALQKLIPDTYIFYEENEAAGFDLESLISEIRSECNSVKTGDNLYKSNDVTDIMVQAFKKNLKVNDQHFSILKRDYNYFIVQDNYSVSFSGIYIQKTDEGYTVYSSNDEQIKPGMKYTGKEENLYACKKDSLDMFRFGVMNNTLLTEADFSADNKSYTVALIIPEIVRMVDDTVYVIEEEDFTYIGLSDFIFTTTPLAEQRAAAEKRLLHVCEAARKAAPDKKVIIDLRGNPGGHTTMAEQFLHALYIDSDQQRIWQFRDLIDVAESGRIDIASPNTERAAARDQMPVKLEEELDPEGFERCYLWGAEPLSSMPQFEGKKDYSGNVYVITNKMTASAAEYFIAITRMYDEGKTTIIGQNTMGCIAGASIKSYFLPNTGIEFNIASTDYRKSSFFMHNGKFHGDLKGFYPDYWATEDEIIPTLESVTGLENLEERIYGKVMAVAYTGKEEDSAE